MYQGLNSCLAACQQGNTTGGTNGNGGSGSQSCSDTEANVTGTDPIFIFGTVTVNQNNQQYSFPDVCKYSFMISERSCDAAGGLYSQDIHCPQFYDCTDGKCNVPVCYDTDPSNDVTVIGGLSLGGSGSPGTDTCTSDRTGVREGVCGTNPYFQYNGQPIPAVDSVTKSCPGGTSCVGALNAPGSNGSCRAAVSTTGISCVDQTSNDASGNIATAGVSTRAGPGINETQNDVCVSSNTIREYFCNENKEIASFTVHCPAYWPNCIQGACKP